MNIMRPRPTMTPRPGPGGDQGSTLVVFLIILTVLATIAAGAVTAINLNFQASNSHKAGNEGYYAAETALDVAAGRILQEFENLSVYTNSTDFGGDAQGWVDVTVANDGISEINGYTMEYRVTQDSDRFLYQTQLGPNLISHYAYAYKIEGKASSTKNESTETVQETFRVLETPLVQYFLFWGGQDGPGTWADLELVSGPPQNSWGRVHTNGTLYMGAQTSFNFRNYDTNNVLSPHSITSVGGITHSFKPNTRFSGSVNPVVVKTAGAGTTMSPTANMGENYALTAGDMAALKTKFNDYLQIGVPTKKAPGKTQFVRGGFYEQRANDPQRATVHGLKIVGQGALVAGGGGIQVFASQPSPNTDVTDLIANGESSAGNAIAGFMTPIVNSANAFWDCREGDRVNSTDIDLYALETWYQAYLNDLGVAWPADGLLVYASRSPDASFLNNAANALEGIRFRVISGGSGSIASVLDETTIATDNPYYIQGNFNTINTRGVAVVGDAFNVLSNAWDNSKVCNNADHPIRPTATTYYLAAFAGIVPTGGSVFSGGFINYPRMHECWHDSQCGYASQIPMYIYGSLINLWTSSQADSPWDLGTHFYDPPQRNFGWDVRFDNPEFWPPFVPSIFSMERDSFVE